MQTLTLNFACQNVKFHNTLNFVAKQLYAYTPIIVTSRKNLYHIATYSEMTSFKHHVVSLILYGYKSF